MYQEIINDCVFLKNLFDFYPDSNEEFILSQIKHRNLVEQFYSGNFDFSDKKLLKLTESFYFLGCSRIKEILILMKNDDAKFFREKLNEYLIPDYDAIIIQKNLFLTYVYYNYVEPLKWLKLTNYPFNCNEAVKLAIETGNLNVLKYLISIGGNINNADYLNVIAEKGYINLLIYFIGSNQSNIKFNEALIIASENGHYNIVKLLLEKGANIHVQNDLSLIIASNNCHYDVVKLLLENGANVHANDEESLKIASANGHYNVVKLLLENGANIHAEALMLASANGHYDIVELLLENGANIHAKYDIKLLED